MGRLVVPVVALLVAVLLGSGTQTWKVRLAKTGTLRFLCDPRALVGMKGSAKIVR
jgi:plastocyanin